MSHFTPEHRLDLVGSEWDHVRKLLPEDLEESARRFKVFQRKRKFDSAENLLRFCLAYVVSGFSLKNTTVWGRAEGLVSVSHVGLFYRFKRAESWLASLLAETLASQVGNAPRGRLRVRVVDATVVNGPGATGIDWRVHIMADPARGAFDAVKITSSKTLESFSLHDAGPGDLLVGDRGYGRFTSIAAATATGARCLARFNPVTMRLCDQQRRLVTLQSEQIPASGYGEYHLVMPVFPQKPANSRSKQTMPLSSAIEWIPVRVVAARTRGDGVIWLVTTATVDEASASELLKCYRYRWQIELLFKRLKSLMNFDRLPCAPGDAARSWLLAALLSAALTLRLSDPNGSFSPFGYPL